jgi:hypothetical protein
VSFAAITLCVASQRVFIIVAVVDFVMTQSGNFWIHPTLVTRILKQISDLLVHFIRDFPQSF